MILYEVSGSQIGSQFCKTLREARIFFDREKLAGNDVELYKVRVSVSAQLVFELLNQYWNNARETLELIAAYDPFKEQQNEK